VLTRGICVTHVCHVVRLLLSVFFAPARYRVVKITCSYSKVVL
jgi:hypothetical protein